VTHLLFLLLLRHLGPCLLLLFLVTLLPLLILLLLSLAAKKRNAEFTQ